MIQDSDFWTTFQTEMVLKPNRVFLIRDENSKFYVKKIYKKEDRLLKALKSIKKLNSPFLLKIFLIEEEQNQIVVLHEYCPLGSLDQITERDRNYYREDQIKKCFFDILEGLSALIKIGFMHRDIKPQNVVFDGCNHKLIDFETLKPIDSLEVPEIHSRIGTEIYMAPEVFRSRPYTSKCDIWSLGCLIYYLVHRKHLFFQEGILQTPNFNVLIPESAFSDLIRKMLIPENERITLKELKEEFRRKFENFDSILSGQYSTASTSQNNRAQIQPNPVIKFLCQKFHDWTTTIDDEKRLYLFNAWILFLQQESYADGQETALLKTINLEYLFQLALYRQKQIFTIQRSNNYNQFIQKQELIVKLRQYSFEIALAERWNFYFLIQILSE